MKETDYIKLVDKYFLFKEIPDAKTLWANEHVTTDFQDACWRKASLLEKWEQLLGLLTSVPGVRSIRNLAFCEAHMFKAFLTSNFDPCQGIFLHISMLGDMIGFIFVAKGLPKINGIACVDNSIFPGSRDYISFEPYDENQRTISDAVAQLTMVQFPSTHVIGGDVLRIRVGDVYTYGNHLVDTDFFRVFFTNSIDLFV